MKGVIKGFKFSKEIISDLKLNWKNGRYKYPYREKNQGNFKVGIYLSIVRILLNDLLKDNADKEVSVHFCRDFPGHESGIKQSITHIITKINKRKLNKIHCGTLPNESDTHNYGYMMTYLDKHNYLSCYSNIKLKDIEKRLIFKKASQRVTDR